MVLKLAMVLKYGIIVIYAKGAKIGKNCNIGQNVYIAGGAVIGDNCKVQNNVSIYAGVEAEDYVFFGPSCVLTNDINPTRHV